MNDINYYGKSIYYIIIYIVLVVALIFIIEEIVRMTIFCYNYTYNYNFGNINENLCNNDEKTGLIEYEKARYKIYSNLNIYKFENDLFNKNWIDYITLLIIIILTLIIMIAFGTLFYYYFIDNIQSCTTEPEDESDMSTLKLFIKCTFGPLHKLIPNCTINYILLFIIIIIYPLIIISLNFFKIDYTWNGGNVSKIFHIIVCITLIIYGFELLKEKTINKDKDGNSIPIPLTDKYIKLLIYLSFIIIFYTSQYIFRQSYNNYNNQYKSSDIYDKEDKNDTMFFDIYKQQEPIKPEKPDILIDGPKDGETDLLTTFKYCTQEELINPSFPPKCGRNKQNYEDNLDKLNKYYEAKKEYDNLIKKYNYKYNIYKNNTITFPEIIIVIRDLLTKFLGFDNNLFIFIYILIAFFVIIYGIIRYYNYDKNGGFEYYYNTVILYLIGLISILILSNSILTFNTYFNKFHIYEPVSKYKYDITKINTIFDLAITNTANSHSYFEKLNFYKQLTDKKIINNGIGSGEQTIDNLDKIVNKILVTKNYVIADLTTFAPLPTENISSITDATIGISSNINTTSKLKIINSIHISLYSSLLYLRDIPSDKLNTTYIDPSTAKFWNKLNSPESNTGNYFNLYYDTTNYKLIEPTNLEVSATKILTANFKTFIQIIKGTAVNNTNTIDNKLNRIKKMIEYLIYKENENYNVIANRRLLLNLSLIADKFYTEYLFKDDRNIEKIDLTITNDLIIKYKYNLSVINDVVFYYGEFLLKVRKIVIDLFNSSSVYCDSNINDINIYDKLNEYISLITVNNNKFKTVQEEPKINLYKKLLVNTINEFNILYRNYFNIIKIIIFKNINVTSNSEFVDNFFTEIKNNYNIHYNNNEKFNNNSFINNKALKLMCDEYISKYKNMKIKDIEIIDNNIESVSWSFIILVIIFAIILLEPIII